MALNNFLPFAPTDNGTNLLTQSEYAAATDRTIGNQPGIASFKLVNKAARQSSFVVSQIAQLMGDNTGTNVLDDGNSAKLLTLINATFVPLPMVYTKYTSSTGTHALTFSFFIVSGSATAGAVYTNNSFSYTVKTTIASGVQLFCNGAGTPAASSGVLTKSSGTGDSTITFNAYRMPTLLNVKLIGGGGGGGGGGAAPGTGATGGTTSFGTSLLSGVGGTGAAQIIPGSGGAGSLGTGPSGLALSGSPGQGSGQSAVNYAAVMGGNGGSSPFGGGGGGGYGSGASGSGGGAGIVNTGSGGGGAGANTTATNSAGGGGGGAGGYVSAIIYLPVSTYNYTVGAGGAGGTAGTNGSAGGAGGSGLIEISEFFQ